MILPGVVVALLLLAGRLSGMLLGLRRRRLVIWMAGRGRNQKQHHTACAGLAVIFRKVEELGRQEEQ